MKIAVIHEEKKGISSRLWMKHLEWFPHAQGQILSFLWIDQQNPHSTYDKFLTGNGTVAIR